MYPLPSSSEGLPSLSSSKSDKETIGIGYLAWSCGRFIYRNKLLSEKGMPRRAEFTFPAPDVQALCFDVN